MKFRAAVLHEVGGSLAIREVGLSQLQSTDVLIRQHASGLCHTDLEVITGSLAYPLPIILGHEGAGVVEAVGAGVTRIKPGDHVICSWNPYCGQCFYCDRHQPILCEAFTRQQPRGYLLDGTSRLSLDGETVHHYSVVSSHAEYSVVPESGAVKVPDDMPFTRACLIGCGVMTGFGAVMRIAQVAVGSSVTVVGCGAVGLNVIQAAAIAGAETIIAIDLSSRKLALALTFGATHLINPPEADAADAVQSATAGRGSDYVFEAAGNQQSLQLALDVARPGAQIVILGKMNVNATVALRFGSLMGEKRIIRSSYGGARPHLDFPLLCRLYLAGRLKLDELVSETIRLEDINAGFAAMARGSVVRSVIAFAP
jgi:S-(hydroxymethyl)glutathione dehydrogenase/alcohol dehydrogenase